MIKLHFFLARMAKKPSQGYSEFRLHAYIPGKAILVKNGLEKSNSLFAKLGYDFNEDTYIDFVTGIAKLDALGVELRLV